MRLNQLYLTLLIFFVYAQIYSVSNFLYQIIKKTEIVTQRDFCLFDLLNIFQFIGMMIYSNIGDRKGWHKYMIGINIFLCAISMNLMYNLDILCPQKYRLVTLVILYSLWKFFASGTYPLVDNLIFNYLESRKIEIEKYGKIRIGGTLGNMTVQIICFMSQWYFEMKYKEKYTENHKNRINIICFTVFCLLSFLNSIFFAPAYTLNKSDEISSSKKEKNQKSNFSKFWNDLRSLMSPTLAIYVLSVLGYGLERASLNRFISCYLEMKGFARSSLHMLFFVRCIPEIFIYVIIKHIEKILSLESIYIIGVTVSACRTFFYCEYDFTNRNILRTKLLLIFVEFLKGISSGFFNYSALRIFRNFGTKKTLSTSQSIFNGMYNAFSYIDSAIVGYYIIDYDTLKDSTDDTRKLFLRSSLTSLVLVSLPLLHFLRLKIRKRNFQGNRNQLDLNSVKN